MTVAELVHVWSALLFSMFVQMLNTAALKKTHCFKTCYIARNKCDVTANVMITK